MNAGAWRVLNLALALAFATVAAMSGYWVIVRGAELTGRPDNARRALLETRFVRGEIFDRNGDALAESMPAPEAADGYVRRYPYAPLGPVLGYVSPLYGRAGVEAAQDAVLHGDRDETSAMALRRTVLGDLPTPGAIRLTLDLDVQRRADEALGVQAGAVVILDVERGELLALASHPTFDPNILDSTWSTLTTDQQAPLLNRATAAGYQPGGALFPALYAFALQLDLIAPDATAPGGASALTLDTLSVTCRTAPTLGALSWDTALRFGCPSPFADLAKVIGPARLDQLYNDLQLLTPLDLGVPSVASAGIDYTSLPALGAGQGSLTITPLQLARITASFGRDGRLPAPRLIDATRNAAGGWVPAAATGQEGTAFTPVVVEVLRPLFVDGYVATAQVGGRDERRTAAWFAALTDELAVVVVLDDASASDVAAVGRRLLLALQD
jgi:peptidoglycan glycosyltransferase